ncbi:protein NASP homolog [Teleopsis dalmanni]|uniref:protein NASP homolog n=1 Tax=Teleopsis dalmanni TaxID=139649 RepID=UPI0018CF562B|nr:protein NASP homolog [Teleopsis dalmanni]
MSADEQIPAPATTEEIGVDHERNEKILKGKELYSNGSRNFLVKSYSEAADQLSQVCGIYEELYGSLSTELGMPYLLYAKSLIALALDENKVIDVPDEEEEDGDDGDGDDESGENGEQNDTENKTDEADSTAENSSGNNVVDSAEANKESIDEAMVTSTEEEKITEEKDLTNGSADATDSKSAASAAPIKDNEKPSTSNGETENCEDEEDDAASNLQLAWEILELAAKIFSEQGASGLSNLAEVQTELANIEFENNILDAARDDYGKALKIYSELPTNYRRAKAEIHYKIGLTYLMQQLNKEGAESLKEACKLIEEEIKDIQAKTDINEKDKNNIQDMEETKQEIWAKIAEIEETQAQNIAEVRAALDSYIKPAQNGNGAGPSSSSNSADAGSSSAISSSSKPTDISHLIKRKKPDDPNSEAEAISSPAKKPAI